MTEVQLGIKIRLLTSIVFFVATNVSNDTHLHYLRAGWNCLYMCHCCLVLLMSFLDNGRLKILVKKRSKWKSLTNQVCRTQVLFVQFRTSFLTWISQILRKPEFFCAKFFSPFSVEKNPVSKNTNDFFLEMIHNSFNPKNILSNDP